MEDNLSLTNGDKDLLHGAEIGWKTRGKQKVEDGVVQDHDTTNTSTPGLTAASWQIHRQTTTPTNQQIHQPLNQAVCSGGFTYGHVGSRPGRSLIGDAVMKTKLYILPVFFPHRFFRLKSSFPCKNMLFVLSSIKMCQCETPTSKSGSQRGLRAG